MPLKSSRLERIFEVSGVNMKNEKALVGQGYLIFSEAW